MTLQPDEMPGEGRPAAETEADWRVASDGTAVRPVFTPAPREAADEGDEAATYEDEDDGPIVYEADEPATYEDEPAGASATPAAGMAGAPAAAGTAPVPDTGTDLDQPLLREDAELVAQWQRVQAGFINDPQAAVAGAADLVEQAGQALVDALRQRQQQMRSVWDHGSANGLTSPDGLKPDTEQLRQAMRRYRALFEQLYQAA